MKDKEKPVKYYEFFCTNPDCKYEWISKKDDQLCCPKCKITILDFQKLR
jgi:hypothetical protein